MSVRPSEGIGKRLAKYRRLAGLSARELADRSGYGLTRGVIANIESGRKTDITVDQLIALAYVLGVPPAVLALPVDQPYRFLRMADGPSTRFLLRAYAAMHWFRGEVGPKWDRVEGFEEKTSRDAQTVATEIVRSVGEVTDLEFLIGSAASLEDEHLRAKADALLTRLVELGVDVKRYKVDE